MTAKREYTTSAVRWVSEPSAKFQKNLLVEDDPAPVDPETEFRHLLDWIGQGVAAMEQIEDERIRQQVFALLEGVDVLHRQGLGRLLELVASASNAIVLDMVTADPIVQSLLELYDLPAEGEHEQVQQALEPVYAYIESHGGKLELLDVQAGQVRVRLSGACGSCPGSAGTLERVVEEALREGFPTFTSLVAEAPPPPQRTTISLHPTPVRRPRWVDMGSIEEFPTGEMRALWLEGQGVLLVQLDGEVYAHHNACPPGSALALHFGELSGSTLVCPWHGCRYDIRTGKRQDAEGRLGVLPVAVKDGMVKIAMGVEVVPTP